MGTEQYFSKNICNLCGLSNPSREHPLTELKEFFFSFHSNKLLFLSRPQDIMFHHRTTTILVLTFRWFYILVIIQESVYLTHSDGGNTK